MNTRIQSVLRAGAIALALALSSIANTGSAAPASGDRAKMRLDLNGSVPVASVAGLVVGSSIQQAYETLGEPSRRLAQDQWILFGDYCIDGSAAHGSLVVSFAGDKVSSMEVVTPREGIALCRTNGVAPSFQLVARN